MLKQAWNEVADYLPYGVRSYFEGDRHIKIDGTPYHIENKWAAYAHKPEAKISLALGLVHGGLEMLSKGTINIFDLDVMMTAGLGTLCAASAAIGITWTFNRFYDPISKKGKAIDTQGRDMSRSALKLKDYTALKKARNGGMVLAGMGAVMDVMQVIAPNEESMMPFIGDPLHPYMLTMILAGASVATRMEKLLNGDYCFCDEPPAKPKARKKLPDVMAGGAMQPQYAPIPAPMK